MRKQIKLSSQRSTKSIAHKSVAANKPQKALKISTVLAIALLNLHLNNKH
jgi:hypothetical protein